MLGFEFVFDTIRRARVDAQYAEEIANYTKETVPIEDLIRKGEVPGSEGRIIQVAKLGPDGWSKPLSSSHRLSQKINNDEVVVTEQPVGNTTVVRAYSGAPDNVVVRARPDEYPIGHTHSNEEWWKPSGIDKHTLRAANIASAAGVFLSLPHIAALRKQLEALESAAVVNAEEYRAALKAYMDALKNGDGEIDGARASIIHTIQWGDAEDQKTEFDPDGRVWSPSISVEELLEANRKIPRRGD
jgi:hypothetical protein